MAACIAVRCKEAEGENQAGCRLAETTAIEEKKAEMQKIFGTVTAGCIPA